MDISSTRKVLEQAAEQRKCPMHLWGNLDVHLWESLRKESSVVPKQLSVLVPA